MIAVMTQDGGGGCWVGKALLNEQLSHDKLFIQQGGGGLGVNASARAVSVTRAERSGRLDALR